MNDEPSVRAACGAEQYASIARPACNKTSVYRGLGIPRFMMRETLSGDCCFAESGLALHELAVALDAHEHSGADEERQQRRAAVGEER